MQRDHFHCFVCPELCSLRRVFLVHLLSEELQVRLRFADCNPRFQASDGRQHHPPGRVRREHFRVERERRPHVRLRTHVGRHHSEHEVARAVQPDCLSYNPRIGAEAVAPQCLVKKGHVLLALLRLIR